MKGSGARRAAMAKRRKETRREVAPPELPPRPPKGKRGEAARATIPRTKEPLRSAQKVK